MDIEIKILPDKSTPKLIIETAEMTPEISQLLAYVKEGTPRLLLGELADGRTEVLKAEEISHIYTGNKQVYAKAKGNQYRIKKTLSELDSQLGQDFLRISQSEIINIQYIDSLDLSFSGTVCMTLRDGDVVYCSRRYVKIIKNLFGL